MEKPLRFLQSAWHNVSPVPLFVLRFFLSAALVIHYIQILFLEKFEKPQRISEFLVILAIVVFTLINVPRVSRIAAFVSFLLHSWILLNFKSGFWGWGEVARWYLLIFALIPEPRTGVSKQWHFWSFQGIVCVIYFTVNLARLKSDTWWSGDILGPAVTNPLFSRLPFAPWSSIEFVFPFLSRFTWGLEVFGATVIFWPLNGWARKILIGLLILTHVMMELLMAVEMWQWLVVPALIIFWDWRLSPKDKKNTPNGRARFLPLLVVAIFTFLTAGTLFQPLSKFLKSMSIGVHELPVFLNANKLKQGCWETFGWNRKSGEMKSLVSLEVYSCLEQGTIFFRSLGQTTMIRAMMRATPPRKNLRNMREFLRLLCGKIFLTKQESDLTVLTRLIQSNDGSCYLDSLTFSCSERELHPSFSNDEQMKKKVIQRWTDLGFFPTKCNSLLERHWPDPT